MYKTYSLSVHCHRPSRKQNDGNDKETEKHMVSAWKIKEMSVLFYDWALLFSTYSFQVDIFNAVSQHFHAVQPISRLYA